jgi:hypothetical protein
LKGSWHGGSVIRVPEVGQAEGGFKGFQQRIVRLKARALNTTHTVVLIEYEKSVKCFLHVDAM